MNNNAIKEYDYAPDQLKILEQLFPACSQKVTKVQWQYFAYVCANSKLDPFLKQIYPVPFKNSSTGKYDLAIITGIDGFRAIAHRTGHLGGISDYLYDEGLTLYEMQHGDPPRKKPKTATCTVIKIIDGVKIETTSSADWETYYPHGTKKADFWDRYPFLKLGYCAEKMAIRKAFSETSGIYLEEEMEHTDIEVPAIQNGECIELINQIYQEYAQLGYNKAQEIQKNNELGGNPRIEYIEKEKLQEMLTKLKEMKE